MRRAAQAATAGFGALMVYQAVLAAGAPLGEAAWGGSSSELTTGQRIGSAMSVIFFALAIGVVRRRAAGKTSRRYRWGTWALVAAMALAALMNAASGSAWENYLLAPVALALAALCAVVAHQPRALQEGLSQGRSTQQVLGSSEHGDCIT
ncbi:MAG TPA: hypothetical protein VF004_13920 [Burkholderiales bacterium]